MDAPTVRSSFSEPKRKNRVKMVAGMVFVYTLSLIPPPWNPLGEISKASAFVILGFIIVNYIYDGEPEAKERDS